MYKKWMGHINMNDDVRMYALLAKNDEWITRSPTFNFI